uniref:Uncharacterized protein n=1 Tax=Knipowitschia caucasica TaxID=637954 RepID=A0AAV2KC52_KNICA
MVLLHPSSASRFISKDQKRAGLRLPPEELKIACLWPFRRPQKLKPHNHSQMKIMNMPCLLLLPLLRPDSMKL